jgi:hypothetical protein
MVVLPQYISGTNALKREYALLLRVCEKYFNKYFLGKLRNEFVKCTREIDAYCHIVIIPDYVTKILRVPFGAEISPYHFEYCILNQIVGFVQDAIDRKSSPC